MFNSVASNVTSWFGGIPPEDTSPEAQEKPNKQNEVIEAKPQNQVQAQAPSTKDPPSQAGQSEPGQETDKQEEEKPQGGEADIDFDEISAKAISTAKEWGSYLFSVGKTYSEQVAKTAKQLKDTVEEKTILGEFSKEQEKFVTEKKEQKQKSEAAVAPWVGYNEEETMKAQILALSSDQRNFLRNPPSGVQFQFDFQASHPVAMAMLQEDPNLEKMRFALVPKQVKEEVFWRNYFYRVSLIKQSAQLTSLAQQTGSTGEANGKKKEEVSSTTSSQKAADKSEDKEAEPEDLPPGSPPEHEFISDSFQHSQLDEEDIKQGMQQLGMDEKSQDQPSKAPAEAEEDIPEWEKELQAELQEYEVVDDGVDDDLEQEILQQIEAEAQES